MSVITAQGGTAEQRKDPTEYRGGATEASTAPGKDTTNRNGIDHVLHRPNDRMNGLEMFHANCPPTIRRFEGLSIINQSVRT